MMGPSRSTHPMPPRMAQERLNRARQGIRALADKNGLKNDYQIAVHIGLNSAHVHKLLQKGHLSPTLDRVLVGLGILSPLPKPVPVIPCECGEVHTTKSCPHKNGRKRAPRLSISKDDMESAARSILRNLDEGSVGDLIDLLLEVDDE